MKNPVQFYVTCGTINALSSGACFAMGHSTLGTISGCFGLLMFAAAWLLCQEESEPANECDYRPEDEAWK